jgi:hypothetical protein
VVLVVVVVVVVGMVAVAAVVTVAFVVFVVVVVVVISSVRTIAQRNCYLHHACLSLCQFAFPHETMPYTLNVLSEILLWGVFFLLKSAGLN